MFEPKSVSDHIYSKHAKILIGIFSGTDKFVYHGLENLVIEGPNIISSNHPDVGKGIAAIAKLGLKEADRRLDFAARKELFSKEGFKRLIGKYAKKNIFRLMARQALKPLEAFLTNYIPDTLNKTGIIPVDIATDNNMKASKFNMNVMKEDMDLKLRLGHAIVLFQYNKDKTSSPYHHYIRRFHQTTARLAEYAYINSGLLVPVTPVSIHGGIGLLPMKKIIVNVGEPMYITDFLDEQKPLRAMTDALEKRTAELLEESGLKDDPKKHKNDERYMSKTS